MLDNLNSKFESSRVQALDVNDDEVEIDLLEIFHALRKKILLVLMVALIGGCIGAACTQFLMTPIYSSTSSMLVLSKETTLTSLADLQLGASLTSDYSTDHKYPCTGTGSYKSEPGYDSGGTERGCNN